MNRIGEFSVYAVGLLLGVGVALVLLESMQLGLKEKQKTYDYTIACLDFNTPPGEEITKIRAYAENAYYRVEASDGAFLYYPIDNCTMVAIPVE